MLKDSPMCDVSTLSNSVTQSHSISYANHTRKIKHDIFFLPVIQHLVLSTKVFSKGEGDTTKLGFDPILSNAGFC